MKTNLKLIITNFMETNSGFVDSGFVKTCDELVIEFNSTQFTKLMVTEASNQAVLNAKVSNQSSPLLI